jgi:hypothetical protein
MRFTFTIFLVIVAGLACGRSQTYNVPEIVATGSAHAEQVRLAATAEAETPEVTAMWRALWPEATGGNTVCQMFAEVDGWHDWDSHAYFRTDGSMGTQPGPVKDFIRNGPHPLPHDKTSELANLVAVAQHAEPPIQNAAVNLLWVQQRLRSDAKEAGFESILEYYLHIWNDSDFGDRVGEQTQYYGLLYNTCKRFGYPQ